MPKDWFEWHDLYKTTPMLQQRLQAVREFISESLDASPPGIIRVVSVCAGDGRDLLGVLSNHPRARDVYARLVELNPDLVARGRDAINSAGLAEQIEFLNGDATNSSNYVGAVPADIVIVCGVFGNVDKETGLSRLIQNLRLLSKKGSLIIWTRGNTNGVVYSDTVRQLFSEFGFEEVSFRLTLTGDMAIGVHRYLGEETALPEGQELFVFSGSPNRAAQLTQ